MLRPLIFGMFLIMLAMASASPAAARERAGHKALNREVTPLDVTRAPAVKPSNLQRLRALQDHGGGGDDANDSGTAIDISDVFAYNVGTTGNIVFEIYAYDVGFVDGDFAQVYLNSDNDFNTGESATGGADFVIQIEWSGGTSSGTLFEWNGAAWQGVATDFVYQAFPDVGAILIEIHNSELDGTEAFTFFVRTINGASSDDAPNGSSVYEFTFDFVAPKSIALRSNCAKPCPRGATPRLNYKFKRFEDYTEEFFRVKTSRGQIIYRDRSGFGSNDPNTEYWWQEFHMPRNPVGWLSFCVRSVDLSGNTTPFDCNKLVLPRINTDAKLTWENFGARITSLRMEDLPRDTRVTIDCVKRCSAHERKTVTGTFNSIRFRNFSAPVGAKIVARARHPRWVGYYERFRRKSSGWSSVDACMPPGKTSPTKRCT